MDALFSDPSLDFDEPVAQAVYISFFSVLSAFSVAMYLSLFLEAFFSDVRDSPQNEDYHGF